VSEMEEMKNAQMNKLWSQLEHYQLLKFTSENGSTAFFPVSAECFLGCYKYSIRPLLSGMWCRNMNRS
jgi:hypothetical protein